MLLSEIARLLGAHCDSNIAINRVVIDSRQAQINDLFVAFKGANADGHDFALAACQKGVAAIIAERPLPAATVPVFVVENCLKSLTSLAVKNRQAVNPTVLALTGSNGKTSVKEMLGLIFPDNSCISKGNFNNHLGVPINLMSLQPSHKYAVFELGANQIGDIALTAQLVQPDIALINNIGPAHLGKFGSIDNVAKAKGEIYDKLKPYGTAIINADDKYANYWDNKFSTHKVLRFSSTHPADISASAIREINSCYEFRLHYGIAQEHIRLSAPGRHQVQNALAAASMALAAGCDMQMIKRGLESFTGVAGRLNFKPGINNTTIIDDTYNANSASFQVALQLLASQPGIKVLIVGEVAELEQYAEKEHRLIGQMAKELNIDMVLAVGNFASFAASEFGHGGLSFNTKEALIAYLHSIITSQFTILVKGSRSSKMEDIVQELINH